MSEENQTHTSESDTQPGAAPAAKPSFVELGLRPEVLRALQDMGFTEPMEVQAVTVPLLRKGRDLMVQSRTGSGKTAAFGIPLIDWLVDGNEKHVQAIVLLPTRELALQVAAEMARISAYSEVQVVPVYGGAPMGRQIEQLRAGGQIVCGTPGRILDHIRRGTLKLDRVRVAVLDECDEMLSMGFQEDIEAILERTPAERQTLLFSATVPEGIQRISRRFMREPEFAKLSTGYIGVHEIRHVYYSIPGGQREAELVRVLAFENPERAIIFCNTREETGRVAEYLRRQGYDAEAISSDLSQADRERVMARMRAGEIRFMVATDVAARGIDLENLPAVLNYTIPESAEVYIHRTGRTGRAGRHGTAISLIGPTEVGSFYYIKLLYKIRPEERSLPSETEIRSKREGEKILQLRAMIGREPGAEWKSLARRLMGALDGEKMVAALLQRTLGEETPVRVEPVAARTTAPVSRTEDRPPNGGGGAEAPRGSLEARPGEDRPRRDEGDRPGRRDGRRERRPERDRDGGRRDRERRPGREGRDLREPREAQPREPQPREPQPREAQPREPQPREPQPREPRPPREGRPAAGAGGSEAREFWEVWSEESGRTTTPVQSADTVQVATLESAGVPLEHSIAPEAAQARLYLNLGRKDGATADEIAAMITSEGVAIAAGEIELMNTHSYVNVPAADAERLCRSLADRERDGRRLVCEPARPRR